MSDAVTRHPRPVVLCILDGWGEREMAPDNAIALARTPVYDRLRRDAPRSLLRTSAGDVGLPAGQMGNSEVGHQNIGAGRVVLQDLPRIDSAVADGSLATNPELAKLIGALQRSGGACHLIGLLSPGGVHSHQDHIVALARIVAGAGVPVRLHGFLDGRDTPPKSALTYLHDVMTALADTADTSIASVSGRYYAMDRDTRWDRVERAWSVLVDARGEHADSPAAAVQAAYDAGTTDEFVLPTALGDYAGMRDGDGLLMANFRADRAREILTALLDSAFDGFRRSRMVKFAATLGMTSYSEALDPFMPMLFPSEPLANTLGEVVAAAGLRQLRIAETEKYAHVTFFLNGGEERQFAGEDRKLIPSPKVATYDLQPEMSAQGVTDALVEAIEAARYDLIVVNYANPDMVGHTGQIPAAVRAVETIDGCLGRLEEAVARAGGAMLITADHGNIEQLRDPETNAPHTAHTINPVPALLVHGPEGLALQDGRLADIAPTLLQLMGLPVPAEMTGTSLLVDAATARRQAQRATA